MINIYESCAFTAAPGASMHPGGLRLTNRAARLSALGAGMQVADIGCGTAVTASFLSSKYQLHMIGLDISEALIDIGLKSHPWLKLVTWDCETLPFEDESLDAVIIECALSVIGQPESILAQCAKILKKSGALIISDVVLRHEPDPDGKLLSGDGLLRLFKKFGFDTIVNEDHTPALRTYLAALREQLGANFNASSLFGEACPKERLHLSEIGYALFIARKI